MDNKNRCGRAGGLFCRSAACFAAELCACMISCGASACYAKTCALRALNAYGIKYAEVYASLSRIVLCIDRSEAICRRVSAVVYDYALLEKCFGILCLCEGGASVFHAEKMLSAAVRHKRSVCAQISGGGLACASFCAFFKGGPAETLVCLVVALLISAMSALLPRNGAGAARLFFLSLFGGAISLLLCSLAFMLGVDCCAEYVIAGGVMTSVPGLKLCAALRDGFSGEFTCCAQRLFACFAELAALSLGYVLAGALFSFLPLPHFWARRSEFTARLLFCGMGVTGFCLFMNVRSERIFQCLPSALTAYSIYSLALPLGMHASGFLAAAAAHVSACVLSRVFGAPQDVFLTPALVPIVPGAQMFYAAEGLLNANFTRVLLYGADAIVFFAAIAAGLAAAASAEKAVRALLFMCRRSFPRLRARRSTLTVKPKKSVGSGACPVVRSGKFEGRQPKM